MEVIRAIHNLQGKIESVFLFVNIHIVLILKTFALKFLKNIQSILTTHLHSIPLDTKFLLLVCKEDMSPSSPY